MTVKVTRQGHLPDRKLRGECSHCRCHIECAPGDATACYFDPRDQSQSFAVPCPTPGCGRDINVYAAAK